MTAQINTYDWVFDEVHFGLEIRAWRTRHKLTQEQFASLLPSKPEGTYISLLENARNNAGLTARRVCEICSVIDQSPAEFFIIERAL